MQMLPPHRAPVPAASQWFSESKAKDSADTLPPDVVPSRFETVWFRSKNYREAV
jgi:hypothetical protein